ncbi:hypothetical protein T492DRAFT_954804 [Pavlovales sp. CCMP2436]|nr:hypothetical protein T492DRAFT_954804 [Pavlovales sp. CCMP2436]|mmetsp:Transcript_6022/g.15785  ORF Transcript_6022/g.15785 Transcript_6022/m.15785 type:complete len:154 (-) Transcript_6022:143-604(-)
MSVSKRARDPICDVCGHCHVQGVKCSVCGHVGKYVVPGGPNKPSAGFVPPVPPGSMEEPNRNPPWMVGISVAEFQRCLEVFFSLLPQLLHAGQLAPALSNFDQLKIVLDTLPDYYPTDQCPSYVLGIPCRPVLRALQQVTMNGAPIAPYIPLD